MNRLEQQYVKEAQKQGIDLRVFCETKSDISEKLKNSEAVVIFTNKVSHRSRNLAMSVAKANNIPVFMHHACGVCTLRECLKCIKIINDSAATKQLFSKTNI
jgi:ABC-type uncharacterized transport system substrate-binding protein